MLEAYKTGSLLKVRVQPGARASVVEGPQGEPPRLKIRLHAPARDGEANAALVEFVAELFGVRQSAVEILRGEKSREKDLWVGIAPVEALRVLQPWWPSAKKKPPPK